MGKEKIIKDLREILKVYYYDSKTEQMSKDVVSFLMWSAEPHLETRHKTGFRVLVYLIIYVYQLINSPIVSKKIQYLQTWLEVPF